MENNLENIREKEEEILRGILGVDNVSIDQLRRMYIKKVLTSNKDEMQYSNGINEENIEAIVDEIQKIMIDNRISVLEFKNLYAGKPVYELANKVIKFNKDFKIPFSKHILRPERKISYGKGMAMTVFEKLDTRRVAEVNDDADQIMYNRLRQEGFIWLDVHMVNIGVTENRRDEEDDGLRIIDADKIYDYFQLLNSMEPIRDQYGFPSQEAALDRYLGNIGYLRREEAYRKLEKKKEEERKKAAKITPENITKASKKATQSSPGKLSETIGKVKKIFDRLFSRNDTREK